MPTRLTNEKSVFKADTFVGSQTNIGRSKNDVEVKQWEFFKKIEGLSTDYIGKMLNIASTFFTPGLTMPSKEILNDVLRASSLITAIYTKAKQVAGFLDKTNSDRNKKKEYIKLTVKNATKHYKEVKAE